MKRDENKMTENNINNGINNVALASKNKCAFLY